MEKTKKELGITFKALGISGDLWTDEDYKSGVSMTKKTATVSISENN